MPAEFLQHIEISRAALVHNIRQFRRIIGPRRKFMAVVKANAYGHGLVEVGQLLERAAAGGDDEELPRARQVGVDEQELSVTGERERRGLPHLDERPQFDHAPARIVGP